MVSPVTRTDDDLWHDSTPLATRRTVAELVAIYQASEADIRKGFSLVGHALDRIVEAMGGRGMHLQGRHQRNDLNWHEPDEVLTHLRRQTWRRLIERSQIRKAMSIAAWEKLEKQVDQEEPPEVTIENVESMIAQFREEGPAMLAAAVKEVFEFLRPHGDRFKTNSQYEIGERVVLEGWVRRGWKSDSWRPSDYREQSMTALENVFLMVDGKVRLGDDNYYSELSRAISAAQGVCAGETEYFSFRGFAKGTLHLKFRRPDLVKRLNAIAGGARLKPREAA